MLEISGTKVLLSHTQLEIITEAVAGAEVLTQKYVGSTSGFNGTSYVPEINKPLLHDWLKTSPVEEDFIDSMKLSMKLRETKP